MAAASTLFVTVLLMALAALFNTGHAFFLPSFSSSSSSSGYKKPEGWSMQELSQLAMAGHAFPLAVPYPVPVPAAAPLQVAYRRRPPAPAPGPPPPPAPHAQMAPPSSQPPQMPMQLQQLPLGALPGLGPSAAALYQSMQLVPCLCSVPKEDVDEGMGGSVGVNAPPAPPPQQPNN